MSELLDRAREIYESLPIADLKAAGIWPTRDYELVYNNPPYQALGPIQPETIYSWDKTITFPRKLALYVHFPFCQSICAYCHYARWQRSEAEMEAYLDLLLREFCLSGETAEIDQASAQSLHLGGGTPSLLTPKQLKKLLSALRPRFGLEPGLEMTLEGNPASITRKWLETALSLGFNRLNIGIQSFEDHLLQACDRPHDGKKARDVIELAKDTGFDNLNLDLIFGLPGQNFEDWQRSLQTLIQHQPASVTCYRLRRNPRSRFGRMPDSAFPSSEDQLLMHIMAIEALCEAGYQPWHFENLFVLDPKYTHQHQEHKWQQGELLGLGVSAYSYINDCVYHNTSSLEEYYKSIRKDRLPIKVGRRLGETEQMHRWMVLGLMMLTVGQEPFQGRFGIKPSEVFTEPLRRLEKLGLLEITDDLIKVTRYPGLLFPMEIMTQFYTHDDIARLRAKGLHYGSFPIR